MSTTLDRPVLPAAAYKIRRSVMRATVVRRPSYQHWWLHDVLPIWLRDAIRALPFPAGLRE